MFAILSFQGELAGFELRGGGVGETVQFDQPWLQL